MGLVITGGRLIGSTVDGLFPSSGTDI